jgi:hypothetical protein
MPSPIPEALTLEPINRDLSAALHDTLMVIGGILNLLLHPSGFDGPQRSSRLLDLVQDPFHSVLDLIREILDAFASAYGIRYIGHASFLSDDSLRAKHNAFVRRSCAPPAETGQMEYAEGLSALRRRHHHRHMLRGSPHPPVVRSQTRGDDI